MPHDKDSYIAELLCEIKHNNLRRAPWHDYFSPCYYLITFSKNHDSRVPRFSDIVCRANGIVTTEFTPTGWDIFNSIKLFQHDYSDIKFGRFVIMPDHVHLIFRVLNRTDKSLSNYMASLKGYCTRAFRKSIPEAEDLQFSIFEPGFNDRILLYSNQLQTWTNYILDNPRRLFLMKENPRFFERSELIINNSRHFQVYGNRHILQYPEKAQVVYHRRYNDTEWSEIKNNYLRIARNRGVLISPFIHPKEKEVINEALKLGGRIIIIQQYPFLDKEKPSGNHYNCCSEGIMTFVSLHESIPKVKQEGISYRICQRMNNMAEWLATAHSSQIRFA